MSTKLQENREKLALLLSQVRELETKQEAETKAAEQAKVTAIRSLEEESDIHTLMGVCLEYDITTVGDLVRIFRMRGPKREINTVQVDDVMHYVRRCPQSTAAEIIAATGCDSDIPRRLAASNHLLSFGKAKGKKYSIK